MKKFISLILLCTLGFISSACGIATGDGGCYPPAIQYKNTLYFGDGWTTNELPERFVEAGEITSLRTLSELPTHNFESNLDFKDGVIFENAETPDVICLKFTNLQNQEVYELWKTSKLRQQELDERNKQNQSNN